MDHAKVNPQKQQSQKQFTQLQNGPVENRQCTDLLCCALYIISTCAMVVVASIGWKLGKPQQLTAVYDASGRSCGIDIPTKPYLYFATPHPDYLNRTTCVSRCPLFLAGLPKPRDLDCEPNQLVKSCFEYCQIFSTVPDINQLNFQDMLCIYNSTVVLNRLCWPSQEVFTKLGDQLSKGDVENNFGNKLHIDVMAEWVNNLKLSVNVIAGSIGWAFLFGVSYLLFVRYFADIIVWGSLITYLALLITLMALCFTRASQMQKDRDIQIKDQQSANASIGQTSEQNIFALQMIGYILIGIISISVLLVICQYNKIRLAIAIVKTATLFVKDVKAAMSIPIIFTFIIAAFLVFWLFGLFYLYSMGEISKATDSPFSAVKHTKTQSTMIWFFFFFGLWETAFLQSLSQFIVSSSACIWYFSLKSELHAPVSRSFFRAIKYHLGSIAFGSFFIAVCQIIRFILAYFEWQAKRAGASQNKCFQCFLAFVQCMVSCIERFIKFINKSAFIQIALMGENFCLSAKEIMQLLWNNAGRTSIINGIGGMFISVGIFFIAIATVLINYGILTSVEPYKQDLTSPIFPCIIILVIAYAIGTVFMSVYGMGIDSIFICFLYDEQIQKANFGQPKHCPELLLEFLETNTKK